MPAPAPEAAAPAPAPAPAPEAAPPAPAGGPAPSPAEPRNPAPAPPPVSYDPADYEPRAAYGPIEAVDNADLTPKDMLAFVEAAVRHFGLVGHNTLGFDELLDHGVPQIITKMFQLNRMFRNERKQTAQDAAIANHRVEIEFTDVTIGRPTYATYVTGSRADLLPDRARLSGQTYSSPLTLAARVRLTAYHEGGHEETRTAEVPPFQAAWLPIMVGCNRCHTHHATRAALKEMREDPTDPGGYFIAKRGEWAVELLENTRFNSLHVHRHMSANEVVRGEFISQPGGPFENSAQVIVRYMQNGALTVEINSTKVAKVRIPFYLVYRVFGMMSDRAVVETVVFDPERPTPVTARMLEVLERALHAPAGPLAPLANETERERIVAGLAVELSKHVTNPGAYMTSEHAVQYLNSNLLDIFDAVILPHVGVTPDARIRKLRFLGLIIHKILLVDLEVLPATDRNSLRIKRGHGAGVSIAKAFKTQFNNSVVAPLVSAFKRELKNNPFGAIAPKNIVDTFKNAIAMTTTDLNRAMEIAITSGNKPIVVRQRVATNRIASQALERKNVLNVISTLRTVTAHNASNASKATAQADEMRRVHNTFPGFICVAQSADTGENVGMRKQLAATATVFAAGAAAAFRLRLESDPALVPLERVAPAEMAAGDLARVFVNGEWVGCCRAAHAFAGRYRALRREGRIAEAQTTIYWDPVTDEVEFWLDVGRFGHPALLVDNNLAAYDAARAAGAPVPFVQNVRFARRHVDGLLRGALGLEDLVREGVAEYLTPEECENCLIAPSIDDLRRARHDVTLRYTHCHVPQQIFGLTALMSPHAQCTQPARVTYETNQGRQTAGWYSLAFPYRVDKNRIFQLYCQVPCVRTIAHQFVLPNGMNAIVGYTSSGARGDNQEDSAIVCKAAADRGLFEGAFYKVESAELERGEEFRNPDALTTKNLKPNASYEKLVDGFVPVGTVVRKGDVLIGRVAKIVRGHARGAGAAAPDPDAQYLFTDRSVVYKGNEPGYVDYVLRPRGADNERFGIVRLVFVRPLGVGDKMSSREGNKAIAAGLKPQSDMPFIARTGVTPDLLINNHCLAGDTPITTYYGVSRRIDAMPLAGGERVWGWSEEKRGFVESEQMCLMPQGEQAVIRLTLEDGRTLTCTPNHPILTWQPNLPAPEGEEPEMHGVWVLAGDLATAQAAGWDAAHRVVMGLEAPLDAPTRAERAIECAWRLEAGAFAFTMTDAAEREKALAFARILGMVLSDGTASTYARTPVVRMYIGHEIDLDAAQRDVRLITGQTCMPHHASDSIWVASLPAALARAVLSVEGFTTGAKVLQAAKWPEFLLAVGCPISIIREFLGGLYGGDGHAPYLNTSSAASRKAKNGLDRLTLRGICFDQSIAADHQESMKAKMQQLCALLGRVGVSGGTVYGPIERMSSQQARDGIKRLQFGVRLPSETIEFAEKVGFRYCIQKQARLTAATAYWRYIATIRRQHETVLAQTCAMYDQKVGTLRECLDFAREELLLGEAPLNPYYSLLTINVVNNRRARGSSALAKLDYTRIDDVETFFRRAGVFTWFHCGEDQGRKRNYVTLLADRHIAAYTLRVLDMRDAGRAPVFDIAIPKQHSFCSNGICTSNSFPTRMIIGQLFETSLAQVCAERGCVTDGTSFLPVAYDDVGAELVRLGFRWNGRETLVSGDRGEVLDAAIFVGPTYYQRLQKFVLDDEYAVAGSGPTDATTGQPLGGKNSSGGLRLGEMERWCLQSHGAVRNDLEKTHDDSDGRTMYVCRNCGDRAICNPREGIYRCLNCRELADIAAVDSRKTAMVFLDELAGSNVKVRLGLTPRTFVEYPPGHEDAPTADSEPEPEPKREGDAQA